MAYLRNKVLEQAKQWKECNILIMLDLDFVDFDENEFIDACDKTIEKVESDKVNKNGLKLQEDFSSEKFCDNILKEL